MGTEDSTTPAPGGRPRRRWLRNIVIGALTVGMAAGVAVIAPGAASAAGCGGVADAPLLGFVWGSDVVVDTTFAGGPGATVEYSYRVSGTAPELKVYVQAQGYVNGQPRWFDLPTGSTGVSRVPWDVAAGTPVVHASGVRNGTPVTFECALVAGGGTPGGPRGQ